MDLFSGIGAFIVGVTVAVGGLFSPAAAPNVVQPHFDKAFAAVDNIGTPAASTGLVTANVKTTPAVSNADTNTNYQEYYSEDVFEDIKKNAPDPEEADAALEDKLVAKHLQVSDLNPKADEYGYKMLDTGVFDYSFEFSAVPDFSSATEEQMQSAYLYCLNREVKATNAYFEGMMPPLKFLDVNHPELYYGKLNVSYSNCNVLNLVFINDKYCSAIKKLNVDADCDQVDSYLSTKHKFVQALNREKYDQLHAPTTFEGREKLFNGCMDEKREYFDRMKKTEFGDNTTEDEMAEYCANNLVEKFGDPKYCDVMTSLYPAVKCNDKLLNTPPRVMYDTFEGWLSTMNPSAIMEYNLKTT